MSIRTNAVSRPFPSGTTAPEGKAVSQLERIGGTPLLDLSELVGRSGVRLCAKAEMANPGGSVKDRPALAMVEEAEARGLLGGEPGRGRRILDATSGNTGIALAMIGAAKGYGVTLAMPGNASPERRRMLGAYGAEVISTDPLEGSDGAIVEARRRAAESPDAYVYLDQYANPANWGAHYRGTGPEIWRQTGGRVTHFVTGLGTSGTFTGVGRYLREAAAREGRRMHLVSVEPDSPLHGLEGMKHMASALVPAIYDPELADEAREIATEEAYRTVLRLAREMGLLVGISAGANVASALALAAEVPEGSVVVTVLCDGAEKYLSDSFWTREL